MPKPKVVTIIAPKSELDAFLRYFYRVEEVAQNEGYNTSAWWQKRGVEEFHDRLMKAQKGGA